MTTNPNEIIGVRREVLLATFSYVDAPDGDPVYKLVDEALQSLRKDNPPGYRWQLMPEKPTENMRPNHLKSLGGEIMTDQNTEHLGDGVYATFDGFGIALRANDHRNPIAVYIEPDVLKRLNDFYQSKIKEKK